MADSDEELDRHRNRDKFRRERSDYDNRRRPGDKREPFDDRGAVGTGSYDRNQRNTGEVRALLDRGRSPIGDPPYKRPRRAYGEYHNSNSRRRDMRIGGNTEEDGIYRPSMLPFKRFLEPLDDLITEEEACCKFREYKESYTRRHIEEFFEAHKNEEWLRNRYHPDHAPARKEQNLCNLKHRLSIFIELYEKGLFDNQPVQMDNSEQLIKLMDTIVIKLEGGSDEDVKVLDVDEHDRFAEEERNDSRRRTISASSNQLNSEHKSEDGDGETDLDGEDSDEAKSCKIHNGHKSLEQDLSPQRQASPRQSSHLSHDKRHDSMSSAPAHSDDESDQKSPSKNVDERCDNDIPEENSDASSGNSIEEDAPTPTTAEPPTGSTLEDNQLPSVHIEPSAEDSVRSNPIPEASKNYPLHKTASIFFRALPPSVSEQELRELCASQPDFLRLALWDPVPERRFTRHAWATYKPTVNIKKVCWALNTSPLLREKLTLSNGELGATVNRDLAQRVRPLTPLTRHRPVMRHDLIRAAQLIAKMDNEHGLWESSVCVEDAEIDAHVNTAISKLKISNSTLLSLAIRSRNPLLSNLTDFIVEEGGSEEEALLGTSLNEDDEPPTDRGDAVRSSSVVLEYDSELANRLDYLIMYLRVVHSIDFYAAMMYPMEDSMPHRCGILHARGDRGLNPSVLGGRPGGLVFNQREIDEHLKNFGLKLKPLIEIAQELSEDDMRKFGMRDPEKAAENFIEANIQKRTGKKKPFKVVWVCPLSDKKFREPIFVRKHILNKHMEKVEAAKKDNAVFFNNYLRDPRRPTLPEAPSHQSFSDNNTQSYRGSRGGGRYGGGGYRGPYRQNNPINSLLPTYGRGPNSFQDYYDVATAQHQQQAMAAVAAAAAAALYPNAAAASDLYSLSSTHQRSAVGGAGGLRRRAANSPPDYSSRSNFDRRRPQADNVNANSRRPYRSGERGIISYNDLDDPGSL